MWYFDGNNLIADNGTWETTYALESMESDVYDSVSCVEGFSEARWAAL
jgi:hypothetical protein